MGGTPPKTPVTTALTDVIIVVTIVSLPLLLTLCLSCVRGTPDSLSTIKSLPFSSSSSFTVALSPLPTRLLPSFPPFLLSIYYFTTLSEYGFGILYLL